jgi:predicted peptidase
MKLAIILAMVVAPSAFAQRVESVPVLSPGAYGRTLSVGELTAGYTISIPENYSASKPVPLVLALHFGGSPTGAGRSLLTALVLPALEDLGAIIVAPDSIRGQWDTPENDRVVIKLLDGILAGYNIDRKKIAVTGFSMGGAGTWHFANKYPERFSAAIPVAGRPTPPSPDWRMPVFAVHSRNDEVVPIGPAEARITELKKAGVNAEITILTGITHYETARFAGGLSKAVPWLKKIWSVEK